MVKFNINGEEFTFRKYKKGDENELLPLINRNLNQKMTLDDWKWKYLDNLNSNLIIIFLNNNNQIVGQWANVIRRGYYYGKELSSFEGVDIFTREDYRGTGFMKLIHLLHNNFFPKKQIFYYGLPPNFFLRLYNNVHYSYKNHINFTKIQVFKKKKSNFIFNFINTLINNDKNNNISIIGVTYNNKEDINNLWNRKKNELEISTVRDWDYLNWRVLSSPVKQKLFLIKNDNRVIGFFSIFIKNRTCYITDILILNRELNKKVINKINQICFKFKVKEIKILITDKSIKQYLFFDKYLVSELINFSYFTNIKDDMLVSPYFTYNDSDFF